MLGKFDFLRIFFTFRDTKSNFMKKLFFLFILASVFACKQPTAPSTEATPSADSKLLAFVMKPKFGMEREFESQLKAFAVANFNGEDEFRMQRVYGGPNDGTYLMTKAKLTSWAYYDDTTRSSAAFWADFDAKVRPTLESMHMDILTSRPELSSLQQGTYADKNTLTERIVKEDRINAFEGLLKKIKPVWEEVGLNIAIYKYATGNTSRYAAVRRHASGWADKDPKATNTIKEAFIKRYSAKEWDDFGKQMGECVMSTNVQLQYYRKDLSNK